MHAAIKRELLRDPERVLKVARQNLSRWGDCDDTTPAWIADWNVILSKGVSAVSKVLDGLDETSILLRSNSPFTGIISQQERDEIRARVKPESIVEIGHQAERNTDANTLDHQQVATAALAAYFNITECWGLTDEQQRKLLGDPSESTFHEWNSMKIVKRLDPVTLTRISYVLGIYKALHSIYSDKALADGWLVRPNDNPLFGGESPLMRLVSCDEEDLRLIHQHLIVRTELAYR